MLQYLRIISNVLMFVTITLPEMVRIDLYGHEYFCRLYYEVLKLYF